MKNISKLFDIRKIEIATSNVGLVIFIADPVLASYNLF